jgi:hypothetical protein
METILDNLASYGPLGLWTASLLWMNFQQRKDNKEKELQTSEIFNKCQDEIKAQLVENRLALIKVEDSVRDLQAEILRSITDK